MQRLKSLADFLSMLWCRWRHRGILRGDGPYWHCGKYPLCKHAYAYPWAKSEEIPAGVWIRT